MADENRKQDGFSIDTRQMRTEKPETKSSGEHLANEVKPMDVMNRKQAPENERKTNAPGGSPQKLPSVGHGDKGTLDGRKPNNQPDKKQEPAVSKQTLTYQRMPDGVKQAAAEVFKKPGETLKQQADVAGEDRSEAYNRAETKIRDFQEIGHALNIGNRRTEILNTLQKESNRYLAGDMFFRNGDSSGAVSAYLSAAKEKGIYGGYTVGVHKAFQDVCAHPEDYMKKGSLTLNEDKVMEKIRKSECYRTGFDGKVVMEDGNPVLEVPQNSRWRKKADRVFKYREINDLEIKMKKLSGRGIYTQAEEKMLGENNRIFHFSSLSDIEKTGRIVDKYLLEQIKIAAAPEGDVLQVGVKHVFGADLKDVNLKMLGKMRSRDIRKLLLEVQGKAGSTAIVEALRAREMLTGSAEKIRKLGNVQNAGKMGLMVLGGDELMQSDFGTGINQIQRGMTTVKATSRAGKATIDLTGKAAVKVADYVMPKQMDAYRQWQLERAKAKAARMKRRVEYIQNLKPVRMINGVSQGIKKSMEAAGDAYRRTLVGRITGTIRKYGSRVYQTVSGAVKKPFAFAGRAMDFVKKKIILPVVIVLGGLFVIMYIIAAMGGGGSGAATSILTTILSEPEQFVDYQKTYDACDATFQNQVSNIVNGFAQTTNLKGNQIHYGINVPGLNSGDIQTEAEYKNGITQHYFYDGSTTAGISSNIEDCLSAMTVIMSQAQSEHHAEALELLEALYKSTHSYTTIESALYPCTSGCEVSHYFCNEWDNKYPSTDLRFSPWLYAELTVPDEDHMCEVCKAEEGMTPDLYSGCTVTGTCYHNAGTDDDNFGRSKPSKSKCSNPVAYWDCDHDCNDDDCSHDCSNRSTGCAGYWYCGGHDHFGCPDGHDVAACYGHVDLDMSIYIASLNRIFEMGGVPVVEKAADSETEAAEPERSEAEPGDGAEGGDGG